MIQLVVLYFYNKLLLETESLVRQEYVFRAVIGRANWLSALLPAAALSATTYVSSGNDRFLNLYKGIRDQLIGTASDAQLPAFVNSIKHKDDTDMDPIESQRRQVLADRTDQLSRRIIASLDKYTQDKDRSNEAADKLASNELMPAFAELYNARHNILMSYLKLYKISDEMVPRAKQTRDMIGKIVIAVQITVAALLFYMYNRHLTERLSILADNAYRFANREPLNELVSGGDEISDLDKTFHDMADSLRLAEQRKQEFVSMISHDLRTPLSSVQTSLEFVIEGHQGEVSAAAQNWLKMAHQNVQTVLRLINELLEIERIETGGIELDYNEISIADVVRIAVSAVQAIAQQKSISIEVTAPHVYVTADEDRLVRVLVNLLGNALKFSPENSAVKVSAAEQGGFAEVIVSDNGRGIPPEFVERVFDRFQQVSAEDARSLGGSGLGLAISKAIIEAHGGTISVDSKPGEGSTFRFLIPIERPRTDGKNEGSGDNEYVVMSPKSVAPITPANDKTPLDGVSDSNPKA